MNVEIDEGHITATAGFSSRTEVLESVFARVDRDGSGYIDKEEMRRALAHLVSCIYCVGSGIFACSDMLAFRLSYSDAHGMHGHCVFSLIARHSRVHVVLPSQRAPWRRVVRLRVRNMRLTPWMRIATTMCPRKNFWSISPGSLEWVLSLPPWLYNR